jgi:iron complex transport system ATP-binding protein
MNAIIEIKDLSFDYTPKSSVLKNLSFDVTTGTFLTIVGPNGAGKSTLLNLLCGILKPGSGTITIEGTPVESYSTEVLARKIAVVRQEFIPVFDFSVIDTVMMARTPYYSPIGFETKTDSQIVSEALQATDAAQFALRSLATLSAGERQRVFIARALAQNTPILLLDEPTTFLDLKHQVAIYDLLKKSQLQKGKTIVAVTHDINLSAQYCDMALLLGADHSYKHGPPRDVFTAQQIQKLFDVRVFAGNIGKEKFFIPIGKFAKNSEQIITKPDT